MEAYFNLQQLAKYLRITESAVEHLLKNSKIPAVETPSNVHIFKKSDIDAWVKGRRGKIQELLEKDETL